MFTVDKYKWFDQLRSIFSIDLISDGTKFAIAQGSIISLWRFPQDSAVMSISTTKEINNNKFACTAQTLEYDFSNLLISRLNHHTKSVNILRFSETGNFLAAGSDDACVSISKKEYVIGSQHVEKDGTSNSLSSSAGERWRCVKGLQQENEVYSLAWSPDSSRLATGSVNKKIRIYDANNDFGLLNILEGKEGIVYGLSWDPVGRYLLSKHDEWMMIFNATSNFLLEQTINSKIDLSLFFRFNWSPDSTYFTNPGKVLHGRHYVEIYSCGTSFEKQGELFGHDQGIIAAIYNPCLWKVHSATVVNEESSRFHVIAVGGKDGAITIWSTNPNNNVDQKPLLATKLFKQSVADLCWGRDGLSLLVSSLDGTVVKFLFQEEFFGGQRLTTKELNEVKENLYGSFSETKKKSSFLENPDTIIMMKNIEQSRMGHMKVSVPGNAIQQKTLPPPSTSSLPQQVELLTKSGKKRIIPQRITTVVEDTQSQSTTESSFSSNTRFLDKNNNGHNVNGMIVEDAIVKSNVDYLNMDIGPLAEKKKKTSNDMQQTSQYATAKSSGDRLEESPRRRFKDMLPVISNTGKLYFKINEAGELKRSKDGNSIDFIQNQQLVWSACLSAKESLLCATANKQCVAFCTSSNSIHFYGLHSGARLTAPLILNDSPSFLTSNSFSHVAILTRDEQLKVWHIENGKVESSLTCSVKPVLERVMMHQVTTDIHHPINYVGLTLSGIPIISLDNGESYSFIEKCQSWVCIVDTNYPLSIYGECDTTTDLSSGDVGNHPVSHYYFDYLRTQAFREHPELRQTRPWTDKQTQLDTYEDLERAIKVSEALQDEDAFKKYCLAFTTFLCDQGNSEKLKNFCNSLLLDPNQQIGSSLTKKQVLGHALKIIGANMEMQRLYSLYNSILL